MLISIWERQLKQEQFWFDIYSHHHFRPHSWFKCWYSFLIGSYRSVLTIAIADALSDALGIHVSEESKTEDSQEEVWISTFSTFVTKALIGMTFIVSLFLFPLQKAVLINVAWGFFLLIALSYYIGKHERTPAWKVILEHL